MSAAQPLNSLKKPTGVYILAFLFLLAPIGNIIISFAGSGVSNWYEPNVFSAFLLTIPGFEWLWLGLLFISGILLFRPHKLSWSLAIFTLVAILFLNIYRMYLGDENSIDIKYLKVFSVVALLCTLGVLVIAFYFRFPYLDRRANWVKNIERFDLVTPITVNNINGKTTSISLTGCRIQLETNSNFKINEILSLVVTEIFNQTLKAQVVESSGTDLRVEFNNINSEQSTLIKSWLEKQRSKKIT